MAYQMYEKYLHADRIGRALCSVALLPLIKLGEMALRLLSSVLANLQYSELHVLLRLSFRKDNNYKGDDLVSQ